MDYPTHKYQRGQVGLIVLLIMVVLTTVGVSVSTRSVNELRLSRQEEDAGRAFDIAETGLEEALGNLDEYVANHQQDTFTGGYSSTTGDPFSLDYVVEKLHEFEGTIDAGQTVELDLTGADNSRSLRVDFAKNQTCGSAASVVVAIINTSGGVVNVRRFAYVPPGGGCNRGDNFTQAALGSNGYLGSATIPLQNGDVRARVKVLYERSALHMYGASGWQMPVQQYLIESVAQNTSGGESRAVQLRRSLPSAPSVLDYALFSGNTILK